MESEIAKPMEKRIDDELLQFVGYAKTKDVDSVGSIKIKQIIEFNNTFKKE